MFNNSDQYFLINLSENNDSFENGFDFQYSPIFTKSSGKEEEDLIAIKTKDGRKLIVSQDHALLTADNIMVTALDFLYTFKEQDLKLVNIDGSTIEIEDAKFQKSNESLVYNFGISSSDPVQHIIFAEGIAVGDLLWQSSLQDELNRVLVRQ